jgi:beta-lactamase regulating signal transducer with metallopeptidase domain
MDPNVGLLTASGLVNFLLKTTVEFLVCLALVRLAGTARSRFNLWLTMLLAFVAQWIWMWAGVARAAFPAVIHAGGVVSGESAIAGKRIAVAASSAYTVSLVIGVLVAAYVAMVAWRMLGTLAARIRLARAMRFKSAPDERIATTFQQVVGQLGSALRGSELWVLPGLASPATLGWWRPRVIVPPACETQDEAELEAVFWHELKHVERRDALWNAMVRACRNLLWFHPAVHHAIGELNAQRELACDAAVVREHPQSRDVYATCLLRFARAADYAPEPAIPTIEMASNSALLTMRVRSILSDGPEMSRGARVGRAAANLLLIGVMAATVPGLNILFDTEQMQAAVPLPISIGTPAAAKKRVFAPTKAAGARMQALVSRTDSGARVAEAVAAVLPHDEVLAAEHRAALGILTESTGMDTPAASGEGRGVAGLDGDAGRGVGVARPSTSWTSVAADAAAHLGPLHDNDHDHH